jgi:glycosyltransferase involved in cell wall biosynthesis
MRKKRISTFKKNHRAEFQRYIITKESTLPRKTTYIENFRIMSFNKHLFRPVYPNKIRETHMPEVSVVIPLFNKGPYIARALNSVLNQTFQDFEVIVVNDGSTDEGAAIVREFQDPRIRLIQQENRGVSAARNHGVADSRADLIAFLDADDEWFPCHLDTILRLRRNFPEGGAFATSHRIYCNDGKIRSAMYYAIPPEPWEGEIPEYFLTVAMGDVPACSSTVVIPKKVFQEIGGFVEGEQWGEDIDVWGRIALQYPIVFSWNLGATCYHDADNRSTRTFSLKEQPFVKRARMLIKNDTVPGKCKEYLPEYVARLEIDHASWKLLSGDSEDAKKILSALHTKLFRRRMIFWYILALMPTGLFQFILKAKRYVSCRAANNTR